jgi:hypothetical protein
MSLREQIKDGWGFILIIGVILALCWLQSEEDNKAVKDTTDRAASAVLRR